MAAMTPEQTSIVICGWSGLLLLWLLLQPHSPVTDTEGFQAFQTWQELQDPARTQAQQGIDTAAATRAEGLAVYAAPVTEVHANGTHRPLDTATVQNAQLLNTTQAAAAPASAPGAVVDAALGLVKQLSARSPPEQYQALTALHSMSLVKGTTRVPLAATPGCIEGLEKLLTSSDVQMQSLAAVTLGNLADEGTAGRLLVGAHPGMLHSLVGLLYSKHADVQAAAAGALRNLAKDHAYVRPIADGCLKRIVWMLEHGSSEMVRVNAIGLFVNLATCNSTYVDMPSVTALVELQCSSNPVVVEAAQKALDTVASRSLRRWYPIY